MDHKELRTLLGDHFRRFLAARKARIDASGPLSPDDRSLLENTLSVAEMELQDGPLDQQDTDRRTDAFLAQHELDIQPGTPLYTAFQRSFTQAHRDYAKAVLAYSEAAERFDFTPPAALQAPVDAAPGSDSLTLDGLVEKFWQFAKLENRWTGKTEGERREHIDLLYERLGRDLLVSGFGREQAHLMRETLVKYPVNRHKLAQTRGKPLDEVLDLEGVRTLHPVTINKYLQTYRGLFGWAVQNGYAARNPFDGLALRADKVNAEAPRLPFSDRQLETIRAALLSKDADHVQNHRWGTLIAIHSGARLNEVAQLHLEDVKQVDGIWCFDFNQKPGTLKKLKNAASRRVIPVHPKLLEYGFLDFLTTMKARTGNERLFPDFSYSKSDGYGRNLGRWVNESLLPDLGIKSKQLTFHSFRHTMIRKLIAADIPQAHIMAIVGHEPGTTTLKVYNRNGFPPGTLLHAMTKAFDGTNSETSCMTP